MQQVGAENDGDLVEFNRDIELPLSKAYLVAR